MTAKDWDNLIKIILVVVNVIFYIGLFSYIGYNMYKIFKGQK